MRRRETIVLAEFVEEVEIAAGMAAKVHGHELTVGAIERDLAIEADRELLTMAVSNLLQNAFKFTNAPGHVWLRTRATADRVFIDVEDQCGGLSPGLADSVFAPFQQRNVDRSGLGLGLSISRKAIQANGGDIHVRNLPGKACIFSIELPKKLRLEPSGCSHLA